MCCYDYYTSSVLYLVVYIPESKDLFQFQHLRLNRNVVCIALSQRYLAYNTNVYRDFSFFQVLFQYNLQERHTRVL